MPDEKGARRESFDPDSVPIALGDGQLWYVPPPRTWSFFPMVGGDGSVAAGAARSFGPDFDALMERARGAEPNSVEQIGAIMAVGVDLLGRNYDLPPAAYRVLLPYRPGHEPDMAMWAAILAVAGGADGPKPGPDGSGSAS